MNEGDSVEKESVGYAGHEDWHLFWVVVRTKVSFGHSAGSSGPAPVAAKGLGPKSTTIERFEAFEDLWAFSVWSHCDSLYGLEGNKVGPGEIIKWPVWCQD